MGKRTRAVFLLAMLAHGTGSSIQAQGPGCSGQRYALMAGADTLGWEDVRQQLGPGGILTIASTSFRAEEENSPFASYTAQFDAETGKLIDWRSDNYTSPTYAMSWRPEGSRMRFRIEWPGRERPDLDTLVEPAENRILLGEMWLRLEQLPLRAGARGEFQTLNTTNGSFTPRTWQVAGTDTVALGQSRIVAYRVLVTGGGETQTGLVTTVAPHRLLDLTSDRSAVRRTIIRTCL